MSHPFLAPSRARSILIDQMLAWIGAILLSLVVLVPDIAHAAGTAVNPLTFDSPLKWLPIGRWSNSIGQVYQRTEPAGNLWGNIENLGSYMSRTFNVILPDVFLMITNVMWNTAVAVNQFATSFTPMASFGSKIDTISHALVYGGNGQAGLVGAGIPAILMLLGVFAWIGGLLFNFGGNTGFTGFKRFLGTTFCVALVLFMGTAAANSTPSTPAMGSPWWVMKTANTTLNLVTDRIGLDQVAQSTSNQLMASAVNQTGNTTANCQNYLNAMDQQYMRMAGKSSSGVDSSNIVQAINTDWEETALRNWVTLQYGPTFYSGSNAALKAQADDSQLAYCHVLEAVAGTPDNVQNYLTGQEMGSGAYDPSSKTQSYLFSQHGWPQPLDGSVNRQQSAGFFGGSTGTDDRNTEWNQNPPYDLNRMSVFWDTCVASDGRIHAAPGFANLMGALDNMGSGDGGVGSRGVASIYGSGGKLLRPGSDDNGPNSGYIKALQPDENQLNNMDEICNGILDRHASPQVITGGPGAVPTTTSSPSQEKTYAVANAAYMGWLFDVPNETSTWTVAGETPSTSGTSRSATNGGMTQNGVNWPQPSQTSQPAAYAAKQSIQHMDGVDGYDSLGAFGSAIGSIVSLVTWTMFGLVQIGAKISLVLLGFFLIFALLAQAFPFGRTARQALFNWSKLALSAMSVGTIIGILGMLTVMLDGLFISFMPDMAGTFIYNIMVALSPLFAVAVTETFCQSVLHTGNFLNPKNILGAMLGGELAMNLLKAPSELKGLAARATGGLSSRLLSGGRVWHGRLSNMVDAATGVGRSARQGNAASRASDILNGLPGTGTGVAAAGGMAGSGLSTHTHKAGLLDRIAGNVDADGRQLISDAELDPGSVRAHLATANMNTDRKTREHAQKLAELRKDRGWSERHYRVRKWISARRAALAHAFNAARAVGQGATSPQFKAHAAHVARTGLKTAAAAALLANPLTAGYGLITATKMAAERKNWRSLGDVLETGGRYVWNTAALVTPEETVDARSMGMRAAFQKSLGAADSGETRPLDMAAGVRSAGGENPAQTAALAQANGEETVAVPAAQAGGQETTVQTVPAQPVPAQSGGQKTAATPTPTADTTQPTAARPAAKRSHVIRDPRVNQVLAQRARQQAIADQQAAKDAHYQEVNLEVNARKEANYLATKRQANADFLETKRQANADFLATKRQADAESNVNHALNQLQGSNQVINARLRTIAREHGWGKTEMDYAENKLGRRIFHRPTQPEASTPDQMEPPATLANGTSQ